MHLHYNVSYMCLKFDDNANWLHKFYRYTFGVQTIVYEDYVPTHSSAFCSQSFIEIKILWTSSKDTFTWLLALEQYHFETVLRYAFSRGICGDLLNLFFNILENLPHVSIFSSQILRTICKVRKLL